MSSENSKQITDTIIAQFGSYPAMVMIGVKSVVYGTSDGQNHNIYSGNEGDVYVDISYKAKAKVVEGKRPNAVRIIYNQASDTYTMIFYRIHGSKVTPIKTIEGVYGDMLKQVFVDTTELYLKL